MSNNTEIEVQGQEIADAKVAELRAMPVVYEVSAEVSKLFPLMEILAKLAEQMEDGFLPEGDVRIEQSTRVAIYKRENGKWSEVAQCQLEAATWSEGKGWND